MLDVIICVFGDIGTALNALAEPLLFLIRVDIKISFLFFIDAPPRPCPPQQQARARALHC